MAEDSSELRALFKLPALELLVTDIICQEYLRHADPAEAAATHRARMREVFDGIAPDLDVGSSGYAVEILREAIEEVLKAAAKMASR
jgi:hypothetical protein